MVLAYSSGDMLYIPKNWYHYFYNIGHSMSVACWRSSRSNPSNDSDNNNNNNNNNNTNYQKTQSTSPPNQLSVQTNQNNPLLSLPEGVLLEILSFSVTTPPSIGRLGLVSRKFAQLCRSNIIWKTAFLR